MPNSSFQGLSKIRGIHLPQKRRMFVMSILNGKKVIIIGDRDGIPGPAIEECAKTAGADVVYSSTECFV